MSAPLPEEILDRFRASSRDRLARVEAAWSTLTAGVGSEGTAAEMHRLVHTLKGDARLVEFHDINLICQKLEDLLAVAGDQQYRVSPDLDLVVTMALDFIGILLRRRGDQEVGGIDLTGFVMQVEQALGHGRAQPRFDKAPTVAASGAEHESARHLEISERVSPATRMRLAVAATNVFFEYLSASGAARTRLRSVWLTLRGELETFESMSIAPILERHLAGVSELAGSLGKKLHASFDLGGQDLRVRSRSLEALDVALLHLLRNAIDHGIEPPIERARLGKPEAGRVSIIAAVVGGSLELRVTDDGRGLDIEAIRSRSMELGLVHPDVARAASPQALFEILFQPRFSSCHHISEMSGRGVGLDAVRSALLQVGATVAIEGSKGRGAVVTLRMPTPVRRIEVQTFDAFGGRLVLAIPAHWSAALTELSSQGEPLDPLACLGIRRPEDETGLVQGGRPKILTLSSGHRTVRLVAARSPRSAIAERICPTPESFPAEVVAIGGSEVLLLRPELLPVSASDASDW